MTAPPINNHQASCMIRQLLEGRDLCAAPSKPSII
ncbi:hypothetical protein GGQ71_004433 [Rhizobium taibaishanense]|uniref:Uncharacterized protein n=1 Tax=Allorhizobium taibaishanense TaxID=887144 RepID=A0A7W6HRK7_9HYPH|nr:hypothetical protein [Allorhizobium taibaishanense]